MAVGSTDKNANSTERDFDVVICGGGLSGLLLARQIRRELPDFSVAVLERTSRPIPEACHKVGESSVELGSLYMESLGLKDYLHEEHLIKFGLRFFPGGGEKPLEERTEIGPCAEPIVQSYQLDRGRLENDLRAFNEADSVTLIEGAKVRDIELTKLEGSHVVTFEKDLKSQRFGARWVVDASGRNALLRRQLKLKRGTNHHASASWFRIAGRFDINSLVPPHHKDWYSRPLPESRWRSTNHFMGDGYWVWVIPLSSGNTSIGVVVHDQVHEFDSIRTLDRAKAFIAKYEPVLGKGLESERVLDFRCLHGYSHGVSRSWSSDRWALVGEAGAFADPLYSPGTDFIAFANSFTVEMMRTDLAGEDLSAKAGILNAQYRSLLSGAIDLFRDAAPIYAHASAMGTKIYWDNFAYWSFPCQYFLQKIYRTSSDMHENFIPIGMRFLELTRYVQKLLRAWAELAPSSAVGRFHPVPTFPSVLVDAHVALGTKMTPDETLAYTLERMEQGTEIVGEIVLRVVQELGPELASECLERSDFSSWNLPLARERLDVEGLVGQARRRRLSPIARDVERSLGRFDRHEAAASARDVLLDTTDS